MKTSTIAAAKNNLSQLIYQLETEKAIHLTRYGKPVAVMLSESQYQHLITPHKSLYTAILSWRTQMDDEVDIGLSENELKVLRQNAHEREFAWDE